MQRQERRRETKKKLKITAVAKCCQVEVVKTSHLIYVLLLPIVVLVLPPIRRTIETVRYEWDERVNNCWVLENVVIIFGQNRRCSHQRCNASTGRVCAAIEQQQQQVRKNIENFHSHVSDLAFAWRSAMVPRGKFKWNSFFVRCCCLSMRIRQLMLIARRTHVAIRCAFDLGGTQRPTIDDYLGFGLWRY